MPHSSSCPWQMAESGLEPKVHVLLVTPDTKLAQLAPRIPLTADLQIIGQPAQCLMSATCRAPFGASPSQCTWHLAT